MLAHGHDKDKICSQLNWLQSSKQQEDPEITGSKTRTFRMERNQPQKQFDPRKIITIQVNWYDTANQF